jgi:hypothetical protein
MFPDGGRTGVEPAAHDDKAPVSGGWMRELGLLGLSSEMIPLRSNKLCPKGLSVYLGPSDSTSVTYRDWVSQFGGNLMVVSEEEAPVEWLLKYADKLDFLLLDSDFVGDVEDVVDLCLYLRRAAPGLKIVLISSQVRNDDFTAERMMACDAEVAVQQGPVARGFRGGAREQRLLQSRTSDDSTATVNFPRCNLIHGAFAVPIRRS